MHVLDQHLDRRDGIAAAEEVKLCCAKTLSMDQGSGPCRTNLANATACMDFLVLSVVDAFATLQFTLKITSKPVAVPPIPRVNAL